MAAYSDSPPARAIMARRLIRNFLDFVRLTWAGSRSIPVAVLLLLSALGLYLAGRRISATAFPLAIDPNQLDFGIAWEHDEHPWVFQISNKTDQDIHIQQFLLSCKCGAIEPESVYVPARGSANAKILFDVTGNSPDQRNEFAAEVLAVMKTKTSRWDPDAIRWKFTGTVRRPFAVSPRRFNLSGARRLIRGSPVVPLRARVECFPGCHDVRANCDAKWGAVRLERKATRPGVLELTILPADNLPLGSFDFVVYLSGVLDSGETVGRVPVRVTGEVAGDVEVTLAEISLGVVPFGAEFCETIVVRSHGGGGFRVTATEVSGEADDLPRVVGAGDPASLKGPQQFVVQKRLERLGQHSSTIIFKVEREDGENLSLSVPFTAYVARRSERE